MTNSCFNCKERKLYCHDICEKYAVMKNEIQTINIKKRQYLDGWGHDGCFTPKSGKTKQYAKTRF